MGGDVQMRKEEEEGRFSTSGRVYIHSRLILFIEASWPAGAVMAVCTYLPT